MATAIEYGLIAALVSVAAIGGMSAIGGNHKTLDFSKQAETSMTSDGVARSRGWVRNVEYVVRDGACYSISFETPAPTVSPLSCSQMEELIAAH